MSDCHCITCFSPYIKLSLSQPIIFFSCLCPFDSFPHPVGVSSCVGSLLLPGVSRPRCLFPRYQKPLAEWSDPVISKCFALGTEVRERETVQGSFYISIMKA